MVWCGCRVLLCAGEPRHTHLGQIVDRCHSTPPSLIDVCVQVRDDACLRCAAQVPTLIRCTCAAVALAP